MAILIPFSMATSSRARQILDLVVQNTILPDGSSKMNENRCDNSKFDCKVSHY